MTEMLASRTYNRPQGTLLWFSISFGILKLEEKVQHTDYTVNTYFLPLLLTCCHFQH